MPLWGNKDNASNSDIAAVMQVNRTITTANQAVLYGNTRTGEFFADMKIGQFAVGVQEEQASPQIPHSGWVLRKEGTGGRAGRVTYEVLVAAGSNEFGVPDGSDDAVIPDYVLSITGQPSSASGNGNVTFTVAATSRPAGATLVYTWQQSYAGAGAWAPIANTAGVWFNARSATLTANAVTANANTIRCIVQATGAANVITSNATVTAV